MNKPSKSQLLYEAARHQEKSDAEITLLRAQLHEAEEVIRKLLLCTTFNEFDRERYKAKKLTASLEELLATWDEEDKKDS